MLQIFRKTTLVTNMFTSNLEINDLFINKAIQYGFICRDNGLWNCGFQSKDKVKETHLSGKNHHDVLSPSPSPVKSLYNHQLPIIVPNKKTKYPDFSPCQHSALVSKSLLSNLWEIFHHSARLLVMLFVLVSSTFGHTKRRHI